jgi:hypothetical protein
MSFAEGVTTVAVDEGHSALNPTRLIFYAAIAGRITAQFIGLFSFASSD